MVTRTLTIEAKSAGDGHIEESVRSSNAWNDTHDSGSGNTADDSSTTWQVKTHFTLGATPPKDVAIIRRAFIPFDLSTIPAGMSMDSATITLFVTTKTNGDNDGDDWINIVGETSQNDTDSLEVGDYDQCGSINNPTEYATRIDLGSITAVANNVWTLNAAGEALIDSSAGGDLKLGVREGHDAIDSSVSSGSTNQITVTSANAFSANRPKLKIENFDMPQVI